MKLVLFERDSRIRPGALLDDTVVDLDAQVPQAADPQARMEALIDHVDSLRPALDREIKSADRLPLESVKLKAPLPRPNKVMCCIANYWEHAQREARPLNMFLKNPDAVIGPGETVRLPEFTVPWMFMHEAELGVVLRGPVRGVSAEDWRSAVFGYT